MREEISIEPLTHSLIPRVVSIAHEVFNKVYFTASIYRGNGIDRFIEHELANPLSAYNYFSIQSNGKMAGFCEFKTVSPSTAFLNMIGIASDMTGKGVATSVLMKCIEKYRRDKYECMMLDVFQSNKAAISIYERLGFIAESQKYLYTLSSGDSEQEDRSMENIFLLNYPQLIELQKNFGFGLVEYRKNGTNHKLGLVDSDLIIYDCSSLEQIKDADEIRKTLGLKSVYLFSGEGKLENCTRMDAILRMKLKL
jgi:ribosomal protein S18 acetylase RimI-like enzyme